jgi:predicted dehydrogenase
MAAARHDDGGKNITRYSRTVRSYDSKQPGREIRIGVIGTGQIARQVHLPVLTSMPGVRVGWVADANAASAAATARAFKVTATDVPLSPGEASDCDVVLVACPVGTRGPYLEHLASRGIAAFVEKPFARTVEEHHAFASPFPANRIGCGFMRRAYDATITVRRIIAEGWLGWPTRIVAREGGRTRGSGTDHSNYDDGRLGGGILLELGCHALDVAMHVTGATRHEVVSQKFLFDGPPDRVAEGEVLLFAETGETRAPVTLEFRFSWLDDMDNAIEFHFPSAKLVVGNRPGSIVRMTGCRPGELRGTPPVYEVGFDPSGLGATTTNQAFYLEWKDFLDGLDGVKPSIFSAAAALPVTALVANLYDRGRRA